MVSVDPTAPRRKSPGTLAFFGAVVLLAWCAVGADAQRTNATMEDLKAAFLFNFTKFTEWPSEALPAAAPLVLCLSADARIEHALERVTRGVYVSGHPVTVTAVGLDATLTPCHLLYVEKLDSNRTLQLLKKLGSASVLSVSDFKNFALLGGTAQLFTEGGRLRFSVNLEAMQRSNVRMSSRLLSLAKIVKDDPALIGR